MSDWTHAICEVCWTKREGARVPHQVIDDDPSKCCFCGASTSAGIYVRHDPKDAALDCKGAHE